MDIIWKIFKEHWELLSSFGTYFVGRSMEKKKLQKKADKAAFQKLNQAMPDFQKLQYFFNETDFKGAFNPSMLHEIAQVFEPLISDPTKAFESNAIQDFVKVIYKQIQSMQTVVGMRTFPVRDSRGEQCIKRLKYGESEDDWKTGEELNKLSNELFKTYENFLRQVKKELVILDGSE